MSKPNKYQAGRVYAGHHGYHYRLQRGVFGETWQVEYAMSREAMALDDRPTICSKRIGYRHLAEEFMDSHGCRPDPGPEHISGPMARVLSILKDGTPEERRRLCDRLR